MSFLALEISWGHLASSRDASSMEVGAAKSHD